MVDFLLPGFVICLSANKLPLSALILSISYSVDCQYKKNHTES